MLTAGTGFEMKLGVAVSVFEFRGVQVSSFEFTPGTNGYEHVLESYELPNTWYEVSCSRSSTYSQ